MFCFFPRCSCFCFPTTASLHFHRLSFTSSRYDVLLFWIRYNNLRPWSASYRPSFTSLPLFFPVYACSCTYYTKSIMLVLLQVWSKSIFYVHITKRFIPRHPTMCDLMSFNAYHSFVNVRSPRTKNLKGNQRRKPMVEGKLFSAPTSGVALI